MYSTALKAWKRYFSGSATFECFFSPKLDTASKALRLAEVQDPGICRSMSMLVCERGRQIKP